MVVSPETGGFRNRKEDVIMPSSLRAQFISTAVVVLTGIGLTGFDKVHWFLYVPVAALALAGITGICPGLILWRKLGLK